MFSGLLLIWVIALGAAIIVFLDWLGRRKDRRSKHPPSA